MRGFYDFMCEDFHMFESFINSEDRALPCKICGEEAKRIISCPTIKLEGITGSFPGAAEKWARVRAEKLSQERKKNADSGSD